MQLAVKCSRQSIPVDSAYCVGAVLVAKNSLKSQLEEELLKRLDNDEIVTSIITGFSRELPGNTHAEQVCLEKLLMKSSTTLESSLSSTPSPPLPLHATLYTTMEPCGERLSGNLPCADRIIRHNQLSSLPSSPSSLLPMIPTASVIMNGTNHSFRFIISRVVIGVKEPVRHSLNLLSHSLIIKLTHPCTSTCLSRRIFSSNPPLELKNLLKLESRSIIYPILKRSVQQQINI